MKNFTKLNAFEDKSAIARGLVIVPSLSGLACPHRAWTGLGADQAEGIDPSAFYTFSAARDAVQRLGAR